MGCVMKKSDIKKERVYQALLSLCPTMAGSPPDYNDWPKTREIADACDKTIYSARLYLLALADEGRIFCSYQNVNNSLRWYPRLREVNGAIIPTAIDKYGLSITAG